MMRSDHKLKEAYQDFSEKDTFSAVRYYEQNYDCAGICDLPLFYLTKPLSDGPPTQDCVEAVITSWTDNLPLTFVALFAAIFLYTAGCASSSIIIKDIREFRERNETLLKGGKHIELSESTTE